MYRTITRGGGIAIVDDDDVAVHFFSPRDAQTPSRKSAERAANAYAKGLNARLPKHLQPKPARRTRRRAVAQSAQQPKAEPRFLALGEWLKAAFASLL